MARKLAFIASICANSVPESAAVSVTTLFSAAPAKKVVFAEARSTPLIRSLSRPSCAAASARSARHGSVIVLTGASGASNVIVAMPSASIS